MEALQTTDDVGARAASPSRAALVLAAILLFPSALLGQSTLDRVDAHASDGNVAEARTALEGWWDRERPSASREDLQRALWLRGILTLDPELAELDFERLVLEFPGGPFSDRALLRLAQSAHAGDDLGRAAGYYRQLVRDYPGSRLRTDAEGWLNEMGEEVASARPPEERAERTIPLPERPPGAAGRRGPGERPAGATGEVHPFAIQLGAFEGEDGARRLAEDAEAAGLEVRLVRVQGSPLVRVRSGGFNSREAVAPALERVRQLGFDGFLVTDAQREVRIR